MSRTASGETVYLTEPDCDYKAFLSADNVSDTFKDEYEDTADKVSRLFEMYGSDTVTVKELEEVGFTVSESYHDRYEIFFTENGKQRAAAAFTDGEGNLKFFTVNDIDVYYERYCNGESFFEAER